MLNWMMDRNLGEEMYKDECYLSGGQRCLEENVELCL